jgi:CarD family transcriptional regulator
MVLDTKLSKGDWIVHSNYGLGQVQGEDVKELEGQKNEYYVIQTEVATYWLPKSRIYSDTIREVAPEELFSKALKVFKDEPRQMDKDYRKRRARIVEVISSNAVVELAKLIRDLYWRRRHKNLNENEKRALDLLKERFSREWSISADMKEEEALTTLESALVKAFEQFEG